MVFLLLYFFFHPCTLELNPKDLGLLSNASARRQSIIKSIGHLEIHIMPISNIRTPYCKSRVNISR
ncbi:hypothetical protein V6Z11_D07G181700 [Gossypium hirsutum]